MLGKDTQNLSSIPDNNASAIRSAALRGESSGPSEKCNTCGSRTSPRQSSSNRWLMSSTNSSLTCWPPSLPLVNSGLRCVKPWGWPSTEVHKIHGHTILQYIKTRPNQLATTARCERNNKRNCSVWTTSGSPCAKNPPCIKSDSTVLAMTQNRLLYRGGNRQANARL